MMPDFTGLEFAQNVENKWMWLILPGTSLADSVTAMAKEKNKLDRAVGRTAEILLAHLGTLPRAQATAMREELRRVAVKTSRSASRGKA
jgi:hypothetical protein